jgi:hypothetical protein
MSDENDLFNPADFESLELEIHFRNLMTNFDVEEVDKIAVIEVGSNTLTISLPQGSCAEGHHVMIEILHTGEQLLKATAKVRNLSPTDDGCQAALLELLQFDNKSWADFLKIFSKRQEEISTFFMMGKR